MGSTGSADLARPGRLDRPTIAAAAALAVAAAWFWAGPVADATRVRTYGFPAYDVSAGLVLEGRWSAAVYDNAWMHAETERRTGVLEIYRPNTPAMSLLALPVAWLDYGQARAAWLALGIVVLGLTLVLLLAALPALRSPPRALALAALVLAFGGVRDDIRIGQAYVLVGGLGAAALFGAVRGTAGPTGIAVGAAVAAKLALVPVALVLAVRGRGRALAWAVAVALAIALVTLPFAGLDGWAAWARTLAEDLVLEDPRYSLPVIQSIPGLVAHLLVPDATVNPGAVLDAPGLAAVVGPALVAAVVGATVVAARRGSVGLAVAAAITAGILVLPLAQEYHGAMLVTPVAVAIGTWFETHTGACPGGSARSAAWLGLAVVLAAAPLPYRQVDPPGGLLDVLWYPRLAGTALLWAWLLGVLRASAASTERAATSAAQRAVPVTR